MARTEAYAFKLAAVFAILRGNTSIEVQDIKLATQLAEYAAAQASQIFDSLSFDAGARKDNQAIEWMKQHQDFTPQQFLQAMKRKFRSDELQRLVKSLIDQQQIIVEEQKTGGKPRKIYHWNNI